MPVLLLLHAQRQRSACVEGRTKEDLVGMHTKAPYDNCNGGMGKEYKVSVIVCDAIYTAPRPIPAKLKL